MNETRRKPTTGRQPPSLIDEWHGIFYMPSCIDRLDIPRPLITKSRSTGGKPKCSVPQVGLEDHTTPGPQQGGIFSQLGGIVGKEQPRHEKAIHIRCYIRAFHVRCLSHTHTGWGNTCLHLATIDANFMTGVLQGRPYTSWPSCLNKTLYIQTPN